MRDFKIRFRAFDNKFKQALAQTYSYSPTFANESDFKHEFFHQLHEMEINGHKLGSKLHGLSTCMLHAEAKPINGLKGKGSYTDLLICNPAIQREYNYKTEIAIELKKSLNSNELKTEIDKFSKYNSSVRRLYIASANEPRVNRENIKRIISKEKVPGTTILVFDRNLILHKYALQSRQRIKAKTALSESVAKCIRETLRLYGDNLGDPYHSFFWRNYEHENSRNWTFPCEGDFVAQLYHRLRVAFGHSADISTEYHPLSAPNRMVDIFVQGSDETVGIEVKINYDNLYRGDEISILSQKFDAMNNDNANHSNFLVVIQGMDAHRGDHKRDALKRLRQSGSDFGLFHYDERRNKAIGPFSADEVQNLAMQ